MSKASALLAGLGLGAASDYIGQKERDASEARIAAYRNLKPGETMPKETRPIDTIIGKIKGAFTTNPPATTSPTPVATEKPAIETPGTAVETPIVSTPSVETVAFNDDKTVPNEPVPFENSYA